MFTFFGILAFLAIVCNFVYTSKVSNKVSKSVNKLKRTIEEIDKRTAKVETTVDDLQQYRNVSNCASARINDDVKSYKVTTNAQKLKAAQNAAIQRVNEAEKPISDNAKIGQGNTGAKNKDNPDLPNNREFKSSAEEFQPIDYDYKGYKKEE